MFCHSANLDFYETTKSIKVHEVGCRLCESPPHHKIAVTARYTCPLPLAGRPGVSSVSEASFLH